MERTPRDRLKDELKDRLAQCKFEMNKYKHQLIQMKILHDTTLEQLQLIEGNRDEVETQNKQEVK